MSRENDVDVNVDEDVDVDVDMDVYRTFICTDKSHRTLSRIISAF